MGNVISIHAEIFVKRDETGQTIRPAEALLNLTKTYNGSLDFLTRIDIKISC